MRDPAPILVLPVGRSRISSRDVAEYFGKAHSNVLRAIRNLECSDGFWQSNYELVMEAMTYRNRYGGWSTKETSRVGEILMTHEGYTLLTLGFTGKKARAQKTRLIASPDNLPPGFVLPTPAPAPEPRDAQPEARDPGATPAK